jgi:Domain of unknown function (DUF3291)
MPFVSVTRLRVRSLFYLPQFLVQAIRSSRQAQRSPGFLGGRLLREAGNVYWTLTIWKDDAAMNSYRTRGVHGGVMPRLMDWCSEAALAHWTQESAEVPSWPEAHGRMVAQGRSSKVRHPSPAHLAHQIPAPRTDRFDAPLLPKSSS